MRGSFLDCRPWALILSWALVLGGCGPGDGSDGTPFRFVEADIAELQDAVLTGERTCRSIVEGYLARIAAYDQPSGLNAITFVNPRALARADELDEALGAGEEPGPLFCAPLIVKDNFDTADMTTTAGSEALADSTPPDDAFMVRVLREAGAIVLAKSNMAEWAFSPMDTVSSTAGTTANAYDLGRVPAGSSGGTASAVAASFGVAGLGSDTGNSIRGPSSHLALAGIRSTIGLTSRDGIIPLLLNRDVGGPMARTVEDMTRLFDVVAGYDPADPVTEEGQGRRPASYLEFLDPDGLRGARIGVLRILIEAETADPEIRDLMEAALVDLRRLGAELVDPFQIERFAELTDAVEFCNTFRFDLAKYLRSLGDGAPIQDIQQAVDAGQYHEISKEDMEWAVSIGADVRPEDQDPPCVDVQGDPRRKALFDAVMTAMDGAQVDAFVYPTWSNPPAPIDRAREEYRGDNSQLIAPHTGMPAVTVPMGFTSGGTLPAGLQFLGRPYSEADLIRFAYAYEQATLHRRPPPAFPELAPADGE